MIREAIEIFGGMKPLEIFKIVVPCVAAFTLMWVAIVITLLFTAPAV